MKFFIRHLVPLIVTESLVHKFLLIFPISVYPQCLGKKMVGGACSNLFKISDVHIGILMDL